MTAVCGACGGELGVTMYDPERCRPCELHDWTDAALVAALAASNGASSRRTNDGDVILGDADTFARDVAHELQDRAASA